MTEDPHTSELYALAPEAALEVLCTSADGLSTREAQDRLAVHGENVLLRPKSVSLLIIAIRQLADPVVWMLLVAAAVSLAIGRLGDAFVIALVVLADVAIGVANEASANRSVQALDDTQGRTTVALRDGHAREVPLEQIVPGDVVVLHEGDRVPADARLLEALDLLVDQSSITGESEPQMKSADDRLEDTTLLADRTTMLLAGTYVRKGRAHAVVVATGARTELGRIAGAVLRPRAVQTPMIERTRKLSRQAAFGALGLVLMVLIAGLARGLEFGEVSLLAVALAVSAIPEGLPIALTIALSLSTKRMSRRNVIARRLTAVETLGSCTAVASDKTGTLTLNQLTVTQLWLPAGEVLEIAGRGMEVRGQITLNQHPVRNTSAAARLARAAALSSDAVLAIDDDSIHAAGDPVDIAVLIAAAKLNINREHPPGVHGELWTLPFDPFERIAAAAWLTDEGLEICVKGATERVLDCCGAIEVGGERLKLDRSMVLAAEQRLAGSGLRVLAVAHAFAPVDCERAYASLLDMTLLGLIAMQDPLRPGAAAAVERCRQAGVRVLMLTGDSPRTARSIARELDLPSSNVATGAAVAACTDDPATLDMLVQSSSVFARVDPLQKLDIVTSLQRQGHIVAVTGDGANDAPALRAAHVGVAMGLRGTELARDAADIVIADDDFATIVAGIEEGRVAYTNVRKVVYLLASTALAEILLFLFAFIAGLPAPLLAVQILWLNLVANGIQDIGLALEPGEGDELTRPPRSPRDALLDRVMIERTIVSALFMSLTTFAVWTFLLHRGWNEPDARNLVLLTMILFENVQVGLSRSETRFALTLSPLRNPWLLGGTLASLAVHVAAMYAPPAMHLLGTRPASVAQWSLAATLALCLFTTMELHKLHLRHRRHKLGQREPIQDHRAVS